MKWTGLALAASVLLGAEARSLLRRNAHANAHLNRRDYEADTCSVVYYTTWVEYEVPKPTYEPTYETVVPHPTSTYCEYTTVTPVYDYPVPTPEVTTCPSAGTYTLPAKTVTLTKTATVCYATTTVLPPGTHKYGYTTTVVEASTHVTCPYATVYTSEKAIYTTITSTVLVCPTPGTYTVGGYTTTITETKTIEYPVETTYCPGTYTHPEKTVTVTGTYTIYTCPYSKYVAPTPTYVPPKEEYEPKPTYKPEPKPTYEVEEPKPEPTKDYYTPSHEVKEPEPTKDYTPPSHEGPVGQGRQWAISYTQYNNDKSCKSKEQVYADIADIAGKGFRSIRVYAPDCDALPYITSACEEHGLKIIIGVFIRHGDKDYGFTDFWKQVDQLCEWRKWNLVEFVVVGNEAVFGSVCSASELAYLIKEVKTRFSKSGYTGYVTTAEVVAVIEKYPELCDAVDIVGVNIQPYFNGGKSCDAGKFLQDQLTIAKNACGGSKPAYCLEAGWPSGGSSIGNAYASPHDQKVAIESIYKCDTGHIIYHSQYDDQWKDASMNGGVEQHFGCSQLFPIEGY